MDCYGGDKFNIESMSIIINIRENMVLTTITNYGYFGFTCFAFLVDL